MIAHLDQCARTLTRAGIACAGYQLWVEGETVHYWFDLRAPRTPHEDARVQAILTRYLGDGGGGPA